MKKALVVGWDGATWDYIDPLLAIGRLPNLGRLLQHGARATLRSTTPPYTNVAWPSLVTGLSPLGTGVYDATFTKPGSYDARPTNLRGYRGVAIWRWLNQFGRRCGVLNVPMTFPAPAVDGYLVTGFDSVADSPEISFPRGLLESWAAAGKPYTILRDEIKLMGSQNPHHDRGELEQFVTDWVALTRQQGEMVAWLWEEWPVELIFVVFSGTDSINHRTHDREQIARVYEAADAALGDILEVVDEETLVCVVSDHGSTPAYRYISINHALYEAGWLHFKPQVASRYWRRLPGVAGRIMGALWEGLPAFARNVLSRPLLRWNRRLSIAYDNIDWKRTSVYARSGMGALYINRAGRQPQGIVTNGAYEPMRDQVISYLQNLRDAAGRTLFAEVLRHEEVYTGDTPPGDDRPDLVFRPALWSDHPITGFPQDPLVRPIPADKPYGTHTPYGILVLSGPEIEHGSDLGLAQIIDTAPTILAAMDVPLPRGIHGRILKDAFTAAPDIRWSDPLSDVVESDEHVKRQEAKEVAEIIERLRGLGYLE